MTPALHIGQGRRGPVAVPLNRLTRHVLITGATGTGKTTTVGGMCERLAAAGVPVLALDAKGDLEGAATRVWCPFGERGTARPLDLELIGPEVVARALDLSEAQSGALYVAYTMAKTEGLPLHSLDDLRAVLRVATADAARVSRDYGLVSPASAAAVSRALMRLEYAAPGAFGLSRLGNRLCPFEAEGLTVLSAARLTHAPGLYGAAAAYLLSELFQRAPEVGDVDEPRLALVIDEAHLLFDGAPAALTRRIEQVVRLIRSKGICLVFATQSPADLPDGVAGQLQTRIQHGLRAATAAQAKAVRAAAETMPGGTVAAIAALGIGQALVSVPAAGGQATAADVVAVARSIARLEPVAAPVLDPVFSDPIETSQIFPDPPPVFPDPWRPGLWTWCAVAFVFFSALGQFA